MKSLNDFIEEAAKSVETPKCPEGSYYDPIKKKCVKMTTKYGRGFYGGGYHSHSHKNGNGNGNGSNGTSNGNGNGANGGGNGGNGSGNGGGGNGGGGGGNGV